MLCCVKHLAKIVISYCKTFNIFDKTFHNISSSDLPIGGLYAIQNNRTLLSHFLAFRFVEILGILRPSPTIVNCLDAEPTRENICQKGNAPLTPHLSFHISGVNSTVLRPLSPRQAAN